MVEVIPISVPTVDLDRLIGGIFDFTGRRMSGRFNDLPLHKPLERFVGLVGELISGERAVVDTALRHLHFSFLVRGSTDLLVDTLARAGLEQSVAPTDEVGVRVAVVSGSLLVWKQAIELHCTDPSTESDVRRFYDAIQVFLSHVGLDRLWQGRFKQMLPDQTFLLESKR